LRYLRGIEAGRLAVALLILDLSQQKQPTHGKEYGYGYSTESHNRRRTRKETAAKFLSEILGLSAPSLVGPFAAVRVSDDTSLDYIDADGEITSQHYAFLVDENEFDEIFERIRKRRLTYWADPGRRERDQINTWDGGRGLYFDDPNGHLLEIITRPYGSGGTTTSRLHPLFATSSPEDHEGHHSAHQGKKSGGRI
jgi:catechol 2,3-dioxygenase-like lactoylglutathione lyase family enzyme